MIRRQAGIPDGLNDAEPAKDLHRAGGDMIAFDAWHLTGRIAFGDRDINPARCEIQRQRGTDRPAANDQNWRSHQGQITLTRAC